MTERPRKTFVACLLALAVLAAVALPAAAGPANDAESGALAGLWDWIVTPVTDLLASPALDALRLDFGGDPEAGAEPPLAPTGDDPTGVSFIHGEEGPGIDPDG